MGNSSLTILAHALRILQSCFSPGKQMMFKILTDAVDETLALIARIAKKIEQDGQSADLRDLGAHLVRALRLFERNPGIAAAADDLYAAAEALVGENTKLSQPSARGLRLLKDAHLRFCCRLEAAADRVGPYEYLAVPHYQVCQAA
jgi:hypothetical protein